jgi:hypothetical protein
MGDDSIIFFPFCTAYLFIYETGAKEDKKSVVFVL